MGMKDPASKAATKRATLEGLKKKRPKEKAVTVAVSTDDGNTEEVEVLFRAIGSHAYDELVAKYPPNKKQKDQGLTYDMDKFGPALIAACAVEPEMSEEDAKEIWESDAWNRGELMTLFMGAVQVCTQGLDIPFTGLD